MSFPVALLRSEKRGDYTIRYAVLMVLSCAAYAAAWVYGVVMLRSFGFTYGQAGTMIAVLNIAAMVGMQRASVFADRRGDGNRLVIGAIVSTAIVIAAVFLLFRPQNGILCGLLYLVIMGVAQMGVPFLDAFSVEYLNAGCTIHYGTARGTGSFSYALMSAMLSPVIAAAGGTGILGISLIANLSYLLVMLTMPSARRAGEALRAASAAGDEAGTPGSAAQAPPSAEEKASGTPGEALGTIGLFRKYRWMPLFALGMSSFYTAHSLVANFMDAVVARGGGSIGQMGLVAGLGTAMEIPMMFLADRLRKHFSTGRLLILAGLGSITRLSTLVMARSMGMVILGMLLQGMEFGLYIPVCMYFMAESVDSSNQSKAQAVNASATTVGNVLSGVLGGAILEHAGTGHALLFGLCGSAAGTVLFLITLIVRRRTARA